MDEIKVPYEIRWARAEEWEPAMAMVWKTFMRFDASDYTVEGIRNFHEFIRGAQLYHSFLEGNYQMMVALEQQKIVGMISVRNRNHISLLFVDEKYHKNGIGRELIHAMCKYLKKEVGTDFLTVRAAPYAKQFYLKLGFFCISIEQEIAGIRTTLMKKML